MFPLSFIISILVAFLASFWCVPRLIKYLKRINLVVQDVHKEGKPLVPRSGGLAVAIGFMAGIMVFLFCFTFFVHNTPWLNKESSQFLFASILTIFIITFVGFMDDLLMVKGGFGLRQWQKPLLTLVAAVPLMVVNAGTSKLIVPFYGHVEFGLLYPLLFVPIGIVGAANMVNLLAGFNGLETGLGLIYLGSLGSFAYVHERYLAFIIASLAFAALLGFHIYNKYPAKILTGDSLTYLLGAVLATIAIIGNIEKAAIIISIPFFIEFFLKLRGKFKKQTIGYMKKEKLYSQYKEIYSLPHIFTRTGKFTEKQVVYFMYAIQAVFAVLIWFV